MRKLIIEIDIDKTIGLIGIKHTEITTESM